MNYIEQITSYLNTSEWKKLDTFLQSLKSLPDDNDGNPISILFFSTNSIEAIKSLQKYHPLSQNTLLFHLKFSSNSFRKQLFYDLLNINILNTKYILINLNYVGYISLSEELLSCMNSYNLNNKHYLINKNDINTFFSNKNTYKITEFNDKNISLLNYILNNSTSDSHLFLIKHYLINKNFKLVNIIVDFIKLHINSINYENYQTNFQFITEELIYLFKKTPLDNEIYQIIESFKKIQLYYKLINTDKKTCKMKNNKI